MSQISTTSIRIDGAHLRRPGKSAQGVLAALAFASLLMSSNAMHPLLPIFRQTLKLDPLDTTLTFVSYVGVLCVALLVLSQPRLARWSPGFLCVSLLLVILSDTIISTGTFSGLIIGRALSGLAGGFGTGSASALVVTALGARGRAISATGNLAGAVVGSAATEACIQAFGQRAAPVAFLGHGLLSVALLLCLVPVLVRNRAMNRAALTAHGLISLRGLAPVLSRQRTPFIVGCLSWVTISLSLSLLPSFFADAGATEATLAIGIIVYLLSSSVGQLLSPALTRIAPRFSGLVVMAAGAITVPIGTSIGHPLLALLGFPVLGFGTGAAYRLSLVVLTKGSDPARQGALASLYGAVTYGAATIASLGAGLLGDMAGLRPTVIGIFLLLAAMSAWLSPVAPRLRDAHGA